MGKTFIDKARAWASGSGAGWRLPLCLLTFWLLFFAGFRLWFILWLRSDWADDHPWPAFWNALPLDLSMGGYLVAVPVLLWHTGLALGRFAWPAFSRLVVVFNVPVFWFLCLVFGSNVFIYQEWHTPLNNRALQLFRTPASMLDSMSPIFVAVSAVLCVLMFWLSWRMYRRIVGTALYEGEPSRLQLGWLPVQLGLLLLLIRGGLGVMPVNESAVYYSPHLFNNHAATNTAWHLLHSLIEANQTVNHYQYMPGAEAKKRVHALYSEKNDSQRVPHDWLLSPSNGQRPNVVIVLMESMTAQVIEELGGEKGVCPHLGALARDGLLFDQCYSSGYRTDQGLVAVLSGFPAQPDQSIVLLQDKAANLPSIPMMLKKEGYRTAFFYGGETTFANIGVWLRHQQFEQIISEEDFAAADITQRWGADDEKTFLRAVGHLNEMPQPFFANILTLSLHPPFDVPYQSRWQGSSEREKFLNSAAFADHAVGRFFEEAAKQPWFANTLFVFVADHGSYNPNGVRMDDPRSRHIPLIFAGPLITAEWRGRRISTIGNHHDIPATILRELGFPCTSFAWSKDLFDADSQPFAYYTNENGVGWVTPRGAGFYQFEPKTWQLFSGQPDTNDQQAAKAYLQHLYDDFLSK